MSREIKFRAWHKNANYMCQNATTDLLNRDYLEFMQYTGLKDKNGTEIYEGDIVNFRNGESKLYIAFNLGQWSMCRYLDEPDKNYRNLDHYVNHDGPIEVIGNIYKNPELLEED